MWFCSRFSSLRLHPKPQCGLPARLGWGPRGISLPVVQQMGLIRASAVKLRKQNQRHSQDSADDGVGDPGGVGGGPLPPRTESCDPLLFPPLGGGLRLLRRATVQFRSRRG